MESSFENNDLEVLIKGVIIKESIFNKIYNYTSILYLSTEIKNKIKQKTKIKDEIEILWNIHKTFLKIKNTKYSIKEYYNNNKNKLIILLQKEIEIFEYLINNLQYGFQLLTSEEMCDISKNYFWFDDDDTVITSSSLKLSIKYCSW